MHAVVVRVKIEDFETARKHLAEEVVPGVSQAPGFQAGYWTRSEDGRNGMAMILFDSQESAQAATEPIRAAATGGVTLEDVEVREVVEHA
jgi:heme-degrading monooxygenase HmoA